GRDRVSAMRTAGARERGEPRPARDGGARSLVMPGPRRLFFRNPFPGPSPPGDGCTRSPRHATRGLHFQIRNPNLEIRNKFKIRISNVPNSLPTGPARASACDFGFRSFGFVSDFEIRISDLLPDMKCRLQRREGFFAAFAVDDHADTHFAG